MKGHVPNKSKYSIDGKSGTWILVYYPIYLDGYKGEPYDEPRGLFQNIEKEGFWYNEMPLRYVKNKS